MLETRIKELTASVERLTALFEAFTQSAGAAQAPEKTPETQKKTGASAKSEPQKTGAETGSEAPEQETSAQTSEQTAAHVSDSAAEKDSEPTGGESAPMDSNAFSLACRELTASSPERRTQAISHLKSEGYDNIMAVPADARRAVLTGLRAALDGDR